MAARERSYIPEISNALLVPVEPTDGAVFRRRVRTIKSLITELEDENNLIAYKLIKTRRRIEDKKAAIEAENQAPIPEHRGFWGAGAKKATAGIASPATAGPSTTVEAGVGAAVKPSPVKPARKRDRTKSGRAKKEKEKQALAESLAAPTTIAPLNAEELAYLGSGRPPAASVENTASQAPSADAMDVDELDDY